MKRKRRLLGLLLAGALLIALTGCAAAAPEPFLREETGTAEALPTTLIFTHCFSDVHPIHMSVLRYKQIVEERTRGKFDIRIYPNDILGGDENGFAALTEGTVDLRISDKAGDVADIIRWLPLFTSADPEEVTRELAPGGGLYELMASEYGDKGLHLLGIYPATYRAVTCNKTVTGLADFQGMRVRVSGDGAEEIFWRSIGAEPVYYDFEHAYTALQMGLVDAAENPFGADGGLLLEQDKCFVELRHRFLLRVFYTSERLWNSLLPEEQAIFADTAGEIIREIDRYAVQQGGNGLVNLSEREDIRLRELSGEAIREYLAEKYGSELVARVESCVSPRK